MKITFLIATLSAGGAERVAATLCNEWAAQGHDVSLLTYQDSEMPVHYALRDDVIHHPLDLLSTNHSLFGTLCSSLLRIVRIRRLLRSIAPEVLVCFMTETNVTGVLAAKTIGLPVVISERVHPGYHKISLLHRLARRLVYPWANRLVVQTADIAGWYREQMNLSSVTIPNPATSYTQPTLRRGSGRRKRLVAVGRLVDQKGFDLLIDAFARIAHRHEDWDLVIFGDGPERQELERRIARHGMADRIALFGVVRDIPKRLSCADLFVHSARYEGFPNAIIEALAAGLCVIATDAPGATAELLQNGRFGILVKHSCLRDLEIKLDDALGDENLRQTYAQRAREAIVPLGPSVIATRWIEILESVSHASPKREIKSA